MPEVSREKIQPQNISMSIGFDSSDSSYGNRKSRHLHWGHLLFKRRNKSNYGGDVMEENTQLEVKKNGHAPMVAQSEDPMLAMIEKACTNPDFDVSKLKVLRDMYNEELARRARIAFYSAFSEMTEDLPSVNKNGVVFYEDKQGNKSKAFNFAKQDDVNKAIRPVLQKHGFSLRHEKIHTEKGTMQLTTYLTHSGGHSEKTVMESSCDSSGGKNNIQGWGSAQSYMERYNVKALLNLTFEDVDDDGQAAGKLGSQYITHEQAQEIKNLMKDSEADETLFIFNFMGVEKVEEILAKDYKKAVLSLQAKLKKIKEEGKNANT